MSATRGVSLHVGLNRVDPKHYEGWTGALTACESDAEDMERIASMQGFATLRLPTADATRDAVTSAVRRAAGELRAGDIFFMSYSGHGGQVPDISGDEADLQDETWCLFDGQLIDDELRELWALFEPGTRVLLLSDSCHSGTVARMAYDALDAAGLARPAISSAEVGGPAAFRAMPRDVALRTFHANQDFYRDILKGLPEAGQESPIRATLRLISGCQDNQLSLDGAANGLFTSTLLRVWKNGAFEGDYHRFHQRIVRLMPPTQTPNHMVIGERDPDYDAQRPFRI